jgi:hypothetical protein
VSVGRSGIVTETQTMRPIAGHAVWCGLDGELCDARTMIAAGIEAVVEVADCEP